MSSPKYASPLSIDIVPSRLLLAAMLLMHAGALALIYIVSLPLAAKVIVSLLVVISFFVVALRFDWIATNSTLLHRMTRIQSVLWDENDQWQLTDQQGKEHYAELLPTSYMHRYIVVVNLRLINRPWYKRNLSLVFLPDNINKEIFRRLRIRLRWYSS